MNIVHGEICDIIHVSLNTDIVTTGMCKKILQQ